MERKKLFSYLWLLNVFCKILLLNTPYVICSFLYLLHVLLGVLCKLVFFVITCYYSCRDCQMQNTQMVQEEAGKRRNRSKWNSVFIWNLYSLLWKLECPYRLYILKQRNHWWIWSCCVLSRIIAYYTALIINSSIQHIVPVINMQIMNSRLLHCNVCWSYVDLLLQDQMKGIQKSLTFRLLVNLIYTCTDQN